MILTFVNLSKLISVQLEVVLQHASVEEADHLDATAADPFPPSSQPPLPLTRRRKSIQGSEDQDAMAAPTFAPARCRREPRAGRHGRAPPRPPHRPANLLSFPHHASAGSRRRNSRAAPRPPPRRLILRPSVWGLDARPERRLVALPGRLHLAHPSGDAPSVGSTSISTDAAIT
jgi:hypothetical protein